MKTLTFSRQVIQIGRSKTERHYFDFIISGEPLSKMLEIKQFGLVTPFGWGVNNGYEKTLVQIFTFRKKPELQSGRVMLYVCPACGDIDCGAITANIMDKGDKIVWKDFDNETGYDGVTGEFYHIEPIIFERQSYFNAFSRLK